MKVSALREVAPERQKLDEPVVVVLETKEELLWLHKAATERAMSFRDDSCREASFCFTLGGSLHQEIAKRGGYPQ